MTMDKWGEYAFLLGVIIAIIAGVAAAAVSEFEATIGLVLVVLGLIVGFLNISDKETVPFLVAAIALMVTSGVAGWTFLNFGGIDIGTPIIKILGNIGVFVAPAAIIVSLKTVFSLARTA